MMPGQQDLRIGAIRPTLFLGLGGTGKEVLLRLRRRFYERMGVTGLPCTSYLWLDTDTRDCLAFGEGVEETFSTVAFKPEETVPLLAGSVGADLAQIFDSRDSWNMSTSGCHPRWGDSGAKSPTAPAVSARWAG